MTSIVIDQPAGMGDIFYVQKMCTVLAETSEVYHPVDRDCWDNGASRVISSATLLPQNQIQAPADARWIDLSNQPKDSYLDTMTSKYDGVGIDWRDWAAYFHYTRQLETEHSIREHYGVSENDAFILCNTHFASKPNMIKLASVMDTVPRGYDGKIVTIDPSLPGTTVFDYCWLIEHAEQIHTVDTCFQYIIETLDVVADRLVVHPRFFDRSEMTVAKLFQKPWEWIRYDRDSWY